MFSKSACGSVRPSVNVRREIGKMDLSVLLHAHDNDLCGPRGKKLVRMSASGPPLPTGTVHQSCPT
jgi:hypothetical protein